MLELVLIMSVTLGISFTCSVLEAGLLSLTLTDIARISEKKPKVAAIWREFKDDIQKPIAVILIINTFAHTIGATLSGAKFDELYGHSWIAVFSVGFSLVMVQWTEILPKTLGVRYNHYVALSSAYPLRVLIWVLTPLVGMVELINRPFTGGIRESKNIDALNELTVLTRFAALNRIISGDQAKILSRTLNISKMKVRDAMIPRAEIKYLTADMTLGDALIEAHLHHHTRLPLVKDAEFSEVLGYVNYKDIVSALQINPEDPSLMGICRPILIFNEGEGLTVIFSRLTRGYQHIALVRNDSGAVTGLITLEDVIEEIIGDLMDEYDVLPSHVLQMTKTRRAVGGGLSASDSQTRLGIELPVDAGNLSEWIIGRFGAVPRAGYRFSHGKHEFIVKKTTRGNIFEVIIEEKKE